MAHDDHELLQPRRRGNPRDYPETCRVRLPAGTKARMAAARGDEDEAMFVRRAIEREIARCERQRSRG